VEFSTRAGVTGTDVLSANPGSLLAAPRPTGDKRPLDFAPEAFAPTAASTALSSPVAAD